jgi:hypothetical protein
MKRKHLERVACLAVDLASGLAVGLPECCPADLVPAVWPVAVRLERLERRAGKDRKHAKQYRRAVRRARCQVETLLASQGDSAAAVSALLRSVPLDAASWRVDLVAGMPAEALPRGAEAA